MPHRVSTLAALCLDIYVVRQQNRRGVYRLHDLDAKPQPRAEASRSPFTDEEHVGYGQGGLDEPRESEAWEAPRPSMGPCSERADVHATQKGYSVPESQFGYDTSYGGGHADK
jgi:hypothetical protein